MNPKSSIYLLLLFISGLISPCANAQLTVKVSGVDKKLEDELLSSITLHRQEKQEHLTTARVRSLYRRAEQEIRMTLRGHGYYEPGIESSLVDEENKWIASFVVNPGEPVIIKSVRFELTGEGKDDKALLKAVNTFPSREGAKLDHAVYENGKLTIENLTAERGYFEANWLVHVMHVDVNNQSANIELHYDTGPRYRFGEMTIPDTVVKQQIIEKMIPFKTGDPYESKLLISLSQKLKDSDYFSDVSVNPELDNLHDNQVPVNIKLTPRSRNSFRVGAGYGTDTGPRLVGAWDSRYLNKSGHRIETDLRVSTVTSSISGNYLIPYFLNRDAELAFTSSLSREDTDSRKSDEIRTGVQHLQKRWGWNETIGLTYQYEDFNIADTTESSNLLMPGLGYWKSVSDDPIYTREGYRLSGEIRGAVEGVISSVSFVQLLLRGKYITSVGEKGRLITRGMAGATAVSDFNAFPASLRFFAGGDNSIRGFDYEELGPRNDQGEVIGGRYLAVGSLEYEHRFLEKWSGAVFTDFGNAFNEFSDGIEYSVGTGVRWHSPVGLIRVDVGVGISDADLPIRLHIVVGPDL